MPVGEHSVQVLYLIDGLALLGVRRNCPIRPYMSPDQKYNIFQPYTLAFPGGGFNELDDDSAIESAKMYLQREAGLKATIFNHLGCVMETTLVGNRLRHVHLVGAIEPSHVKQLPEFFSRSPFLGYVKETDNMYDWRVMDVWGLVKDVQEQKDVIPSRRTGLNLYITTRLLIEQLGKEILTFAK